MRLPSPEQRLLLAQAVSQYQADLAGGIAARIPRGPFQLPADGTSLRDVARFWSKVRYGPDCWEWTGTPSQAYGLFMLRGKSRKAHRIAYELTHGPIGAFILLHSCDNPRCVRPAHLRPGTHLDNTLDAVQKGRWNNGNSVKERCKRDHEPNWYVCKDGYRHCRPCAAMHQRRRKERVRAAAVA